MTPSEHIVFEVATLAVDRVVRRTVRKLQRIVDAPQPGLGNAWDEICVQVQSGESVVWSAYEGTARNMIGGELQRLPSHELSAIWLQTEPGAEWEATVGQESAPSHDLDDVTDYVLRDLLDLAGRYSNRRTRSYNG